MSEFQSNTADNISKNVDFTQGIQEHIVDLVTESKDEEVPEVIQEVSPRKPCYNCNNCEDCEDCNSCTNCSNCEDCEDCEDCIDCKESNNSNHCAHCKEVSNCILCTDCDGTISCRCCKGCVLSYGISGATEICGYDIRKSGIYGMFKGAEEEIVRWFHTFVRGNPLERELTEICFKPADKLGFLACNEAWVKERLEDGLPECIFPQEVIMRIIEIDESKSSSSIKNTVDVPDIEEVPVIQPQVGVFQEDSQYHHNNMQVFGSNPNDFDSRNFDDSESDEILYESSE